MLCQPVGKAILPHAEFFEHCGLKGEEQHYALSFGAFISVYFLLYHW